jgi:hypothetical protein
MIQLNISEQDYNKLLALFKEHEGIYGTEETVWDFEDVDNLQQIGSEVIGLLEKYIKTDYAETVLDSK